MQSMRDKYLSDPRYKNCVDVMTHLIIGNEFTPSEMREMAVLASIKYEEMCMPRRVYLDPGSEKAFKILRDTVIRDAPKKDSED